MNIICYTVNYSLRTSDFSAVAKMLVHRIAKTEKEKVECPACHL